MTVTNILNSWGLLRRRDGTSAIAPDLSQDDLRQLHGLMEECLHSKGGDVTARENTIKLGEIYLQLSDGGKARFLRLLAEQFDLDHDQLRVHARALAEAKGGQQKIEDELRRAFITPRSTILRQFMSLPQGCKFLVDMRADLLALVGRDAVLAGLESDLKDILAKMFDVGLLELREINWHTSAAVLEKVKAYEQVHQMRSWDDLKNRLDADRRVYAFFHPNMPDEPLIILHVALTRGLSSNVQAILDEKSPVADVSKADTAIFYSISNAQNGLRGIPLGNFLIKRVVGTLSAMPNIRQFSTLSPIPGLRKWLDAQLAKEDESVLEPKEVEALRVLAEGNAATALLKLLRRGEWHKDDKTSAMLKPILLRLCTHYLVSEKKAQVVDGKERQMAADPVAHFHLTNGARVERINWLGDTSDKGMSDSAGMMVNYFYDLRQIDGNHEQYAGDGIIASGRSISTAPAASLVTRILPKMSFFGRGYVGFAQKQSAKP